MKNIIKEKELCELFSEFDDGGLMLCDNGNIDDSLHFILKANGGTKEDRVLHLMFKYVKSFHLPISLYIPIKLPSSLITRTSIDRLKVIDFKKAKEFLPQDILNSSIIDKTDKCYRFYAQDYGTNFYVLCNEITGWIENV